MKKKFETKRMVEMALLIAIILLMAFTPIGYIKTMGLEITLIVIPVAVGAVTLGPAAGAILGGVFGLTSFIQCFGMSAFGSMLLGINPFTTFLMRADPYFNRMADRADLSGTEKSKTGSENFCRSGKSVLPAVKYILFYDDTGYIFLSHRIYPEHCIVHGCGERTAVCGYICRCERNRGSGSMLCSGKCCFRGIKKSTPLKCIRYESPETGHTYVWNKIQRDR